MTSKEVIKNELKMSANDEVDAVNKYVKRMQTASKLGDNKTVKLYQHIISEERQHFREFSSRFKGI